MKIFNNTTAAMLTAAAIPVVAYLAANGIQKMTNNELRTELIQKNDRLSEENSELRIELVQKNSKIDSLTHDVAELKRQKAEIEFKHELDSLNKFYPKNLGTDFYERIINNASLLDNYGYPYTNMKQIANKIPDDEIWNIHDVSQARYKASKNFGDFARACPAYFDED